MITWCLSYKTSSMNMNNDWINPFYRTHWYIYRSCWIRKDKALLFVREFNTHKWINSIVQIKFSFSYRFKRMHHPIMEIKRKFGIIENSNRNHSVPVKIFLSDCKWNSLHFKRCFINLSLCCKRLIGSYFWNSLFWSENFNGIFTQRWIGSRYKNNIMSFELVKWNVIIRSEMREFVLNCIKQLESIYGIFNVVFPLFCSLFSFHHLHWILHQWSNLLSKTRLFVNSNSCWLKVSSHLNKSIVTSHNLFFCSRSNDFIIFEVILPNRIICRFAENDVSICYHGLVKHFIKTFQQAYSKSDFLISIASTFKFIFLCFLALFGVREFSFCDKVFLMLNQFL